MANAWFRMYSEFATDPKVQMLSEADQRRYMMLLCLRCSNALVTLHDEEIAFQLRISDEELAETHEDDPEALAAREVHRVDDELDGLESAKRKHAGEGK